uniref:Uncharacterized protein n=1 Tax=Plectus sambesii TaxID=2011161 RepID=A0A914WY25_9BILA
APKETVYLNCSSTLNKEMQKRKIILDGCMRMDKVSTSQVKKLSNGTENQQNKEMQKRSLTLD